MGFQPGAFFRTIGVLYNLLFTANLGYPYETKGSFGLLFPLFRQIRLPNFLVLSENRLPQSIHWFIILIQTAIFISGDPVKRSFLGTLGMPMSRLRVGSKDLCPDGHGAWRLLMLDGPHQEHRTVVAVALVVPGRKDADQLLIVHQVEAQAISPWR